VLWIACDSTEDEVGPQTPDELGDLSCSFSSLSLNEEMKDITTNEVNLITSYKYGSSTTFNYEYNDEYRLTLFSEEYTPSGDNEYLFTAEYSGDDITNITLDSYNDSYEDSYEDVISALNSGNGTISFTREGLEVEIVFEDNLVQELNNLTDNISVKFNYSDNTYRNVNEKFVAIGFIKGNISDLASLMSYLQNNQRVLESITVFTDGQEIPIYSIDYTNDEESNETTIVISDILDGPEDFDTFVFDYDCGE
jgi:hypothetical protein